MVFMVVKSDFISGSDIVQGRLLRGMANPRISQRGARLKPTSKSYLRKLPASQADSRADAAIRVRGDLSRDVVEQLVAESRGLVESARRVHLRGHRELTWPDQDFDSDRVVLKRPAQPKALVRLRESVPAQRADPGAAQGADEPPQIDVSREGGLAERGGALRAVSASRCWLVASVSPRRERSVVDAAFLPSTDCRVRVTALESGVRVVLPAILRVVARAGLDGARAEVVLEASVACRR